MKANRSISKIYLFIVAVGMVYHSVASNPQLVNVVKKKVDFTSVSSEISASLLPYLAAESHQ